MHFVNSLVDIVMMVDFHGVVLTHRIMVGDRFHLVEFGPVDPAIPLVSALLYSAMGAVGGRRLYGLRDLVGSRVQLGQDVVCEFLGVSLVQHRRCHICTSMVVFLVGWRYHDII